MRIAILVRSGATSGRRIVLRGGQTATFGRTDWADFSFPEDNGLADVHFRIQCGLENALLVALVTDRETRLNEEAIARVHLKNGDQIQAGHSKFQIEIEASAPQATTMAAQELPADARDTVSGETLDLAKYVGLSEKAIAAASGWNSVESFGPSLVEKGLVEDAIRWNAHWLPKPIAVQWCCECVEATPHLKADPLQLSAFESAKRWAQDPTEEHRQDAARFAESTGLEGIGGILAAAAGWSGGSLAPAGQDIVPPDERITGRCLSTALTIARFEKGPQQSSNQIALFLGRLPKSENPASQA